MNKELYDELKELAVECEVPERAFREIVKCAVEYDSSFNEEEVAEIVRVSIQNFDQSLTYLDGSNSRRKGYEELIAHSVNNIYGYGYDETSGRHRK